MNATRAVALTAACAAAGVLLGYLIAAWVCAALTVAASAPHGVSARDASDMVGDLESWLRGEGY